MQSYCAATAGGGFFQYEIHFIIFITYLESKKNPRLYKTNLRYYLELKK